MRPLRLELEGFASFRERTEVHFGDVNLFVLSGPMGAGKSAIIDAMGFALYGSVARYDDERLVAPVISQGLTQARVRLDFTIGNEEYTAVRVVRRNPRTRGATTAEARLERGSEVVEGSADEVTDRVTELLGLTFQQFTKCVVLPQGEFAELLHAKASVRQDLLVRLLDIELYRRIGARARRRLEQLTNSATYLQKRLDEDLRDATEENYNAAKERVRTLAALQERLDAEEKRLRTLQSTAGKAAEDAKAAEQAMRLLTAIQVPDGIDDLASRLSQAEEALDIARQGELRARAFVEERQKARNTLPEHSAVTAVIERHKEREGLVKDIEAANVRLEEASNALAKAEEGVLAARKAQELAEAERDRLARSHSAYHASVGLKAGDFCPVCGEKLTRAPQVPEPEGLTEANATLEAARKQLAALSDAQNKAAREHHGLEVSLKQAKEHLTRIDAQLAGQPTFEECSRQLDEIEDADAALAAAWEEHRVAREAAETMQGSLSAIQLEEQEAWRRFYAARDPVVYLGARPAAERLQASWHELAEWAAGKIPVEESRRHAAMNTAEEARIEEEGILREQRAACVELQVDASDRRPRDAVLAASASAEASLKHIEEKLTERAGVEKDLAARRERAHLAGTLAHHLQTNRFERWYLQEALTKLTSGATERLRDLTDGQYSIGLNENGTDFLIVDHINADERRGVRTLSGGETFLASLALALALGDDIASLAAHGAARLDALFLDEGFGTLDPNTLEIVASTIEELGARGRMVGIVTHVRELADRIPIQFRVAKVGGSSQVERVETG